MGLEVKVVNTQKITSFKSILAELNILKKDLPVRNLRQFILFNDAYFVVTKSIQDAANGNYFENRKFIEKFTACFARYYFEAVNETINHSTKLPEAWALTNKASQQKTTPNFIFLLMGANAHINHDLPIALNELMHDTKADTLLKDVFKIDKLLMKSGREVISLFNESNKTLNCLKRHLIFLYYRPTMYLILYWRIKAWRNYNAIKKHGLNNSNYANYSIRIAQRLSRLSGTL